MTIATRALGRLLHLRAPATRRVRVFRDLPVPMRDGVVLLADRYVPDLPEAPVVLTRTPYGRGTLQAWLARLIAERGYQVVVQSCRGTHGSGGAFEPFQNEEEDGLDTLDWLERQPWFTGVAGTHGGSYLGATQWALAGTRHEWLKAMAIAMSAADLRASVIYPRGVLALESVLSWAVGQDSPPDGLLATVAHLIKLNRSLRPAWNVLPLSEADSKVLGGGRRVGFYQEWLRREDATDPWWEPMDHRAKRSGGGAAVHLLAGWYDIFLPWQLDDFVALRNAGRQAHITIGAWAHGGGGEGIGRSIGEALDWYDHHLRGLPAAAEPPVRAFVTGAKRWVDLESWPPPATERRLYLQPDSALGDDPPPAGEPDTYLYDPADPTPSASGPSLSGGTPTDQKAREARADVLCYSTAVLTKPLTVLGPVTAELHVASDAESADVVATLCDVDERGRSTNVCIGVARSDGGALRDGACVPVELWPAGHEFAAGHRIRLQLASAAHPLYARNPGTGEPLATATALRRSTVRVFHDPDRPSALRLPVFTG